MDAPLRKRLVRAVAIAALTAGLLAFFLRNADLGRVVREIETARWELLLAALGITVVTYAVRAARWQSLLAPVGAARFSSTFRATVIGFAVTFLLPARAGEVVRPYLIARWEGLSATAAFATIVIERLLDVVTVALLFGLAVWIAEAGVAEADPRLWAAVRWGAALLTAGAAAALGAMVGVAGRPDRVGASALRAMRWVPRPVAFAVSRAVALFALGCGVLRRPGPLARALALSIPLWVSVAAGIWLVTVAFGMRIPPGGALVLLALLVVGVAVPTPGAIGGFHAAFQVGATTFYAVPTDRAVGAALVLHAISFVPITVLGLVWMLQDGLSLARVDRLALVVRPGATGDGDAGERRPGAAREGHGQSDPPGG